MNKNNWKNNLEEMVKIYRTNIKHEGDAVSCALLPYGAGEYINNISEAEKNISSIADINNVLLYRKIERCFIDDKAGTSEMNRTLIRLTNQ